MADGFFKCENCGYAERRLLPPDVKVSTTPCPECGGTMKRT